jgi:hypothetical protein
MVIAHPSAVSISRGTQGQSTCVSRIKSDASSASLSASWYISDFRGELKLWRRARREYERVRKMRLETLDGR